MAKFNLQQQPKSRDYLECFRARPGYALVQRDFAALEPKVTAYYSQCPNLYSLYGPDAKANDVYLFNAAKMGDLGTAIVATGYDPDNPTPEAIARAKKECKTDRAISKKFTLSANYGAGAKKLHADLLLAGVEISLTQCYKYHGDFWRLYQAIRDFGRTLEAEWHRNDGYIMNGYGRPLTIDKYKLKDVVNRFVQSTGHDILMVSIRLLREELAKRQVVWHPWIIDFHDETIIEVENQYVQAAQDAYRAADVRLNELLDWDIKMTGDPEVGQTLADFKCED